MSIWQSVLAALKGGAWAGAVNTLLGIGVTVGFLTTSQSASLSALVAGIATFLNLLVTVIHTLQQAKTLRVNAHLRFQLMKMSGIDETGLDGVSTV